MTAAFDLSDIQTVRASYVQNVMKLPKNYVNNHISSMTTSDYSYVF